MKRLLLKFVNFDNNNHLHSLYAILNLWAIDFEQVLVSSLS